MKKPLKLASGYVTPTLPEQARLRELERQTIEAHGKKLALEAQFFEAYIAHFKCSSSYTQYVAEVAKAHGIDVDDPDKGRWNFNGSQMTFNKL